MTSDLNQEFYGIGVGPGASDLMTLRAVRIMNEVEVLIVPRPNPYAKSLAWRIASPNLKPREDQERCFLTFPMSKDPEVLLPHWQHAVKLITERIAEGKRVAFLTQGDPVVYSTFIYIYEMLLAERPTLRCEIVPAVTSLSAVPAACGQPLVDGQQSLAVIPATYGTEHLRSVLQSFDSIILMKVGSVVSKVRTILEELGLLNHAYFCERATAAEQRIVRDLRDIREDRCAYFSMIVVRKPDRSGILKTDENRGKTLELAELQS